MNLSFTEESMMVVWQQILTDEEIIKSFSSFFSQQEVCFFSTGKQRMHESKDKVDVISHRCILIGRAVVETPKAKRTNNMIDLFFMLYLNYVA
jgi:hypothetical protein